MKTPDIFRTSRHIVRFSFHFNIINSISSLALKVSVLRVHTVICVYTCTYRTLALSFLHATTSDVHDSTELIPSKFEKVF